MVKRIPSGLKELDELIEGGFPKESITLVSGSPGTGKSILCAEIAFSNALKGKKCLYLDLDQKPNQLENQLMDFGFTTKKTKNNLVIKTITETNSPVFESISSELHKNNYDLIIIDSIESIIHSTEALTKNNEINLEQIQDSVIPTLIDSRTLGRLKIRKLFSELHKTNATIFLVGEKVEGKSGLSRDTISEFLCDNIITMNYIGVGAIDFRSIQIRKMRRTKHEKEFVLFEINKKGIKLIKDPLTKKK